jgi:2-keto-4-pentenoate hydratase/2-oxohepta-3-ene-1,7-dioic acid hydratase (catechol pathway)
VQDGATATREKGGNVQERQRRQLRARHPGEKITTGTPPGGGKGTKPQVLKKPGEVMEEGEEGLGAQKQKTEAA